ncbi:MAG TPA: low molecular weight phosphatase family protein [Solirubrobacteraceae bacterium]|nr:low molecular weight phosphatase family protein [Solirubrobacteraceae bacterium]
MPELHEVTRRRLESLTDELIEEFAGVHDPETVRAMMADSAERLAESAAIADYLPPLALRLTRERLQASVPRSAESTRDVVFVSLSGGGRGQIAAALMALLADGAVTVHSAGTAIGAGIDANVATAIEELGIDVSEAFARPITPEVLGATDMIVTMGHSVGVLEIPPGVRHEDWRIGDPVGAPLEEVRRVRADIESRVRALLERLGVDVPAASASR